MSELELWRNPLIDPIDRIQYADAVIESLRKRVNEYESRLGECLVGYDTGTRAIEENLRLQARIAELEDLYKEADTLMRHYHEEMNACEREFDALKAEQGSPNLPLGEPVAWRAKVPDATGMHVGGFIYRFATHPSTYHDMEQEALCLCSAPTIPEGWQLVQKIANTEMMCAGTQACPKTILWEDARSIFTAMLAAAPKPGDKG